MPTSAGLFIWHWPMRPISQQSRSETAARAGCELVSSATRPRLYETQPAFTQTWLATMDTIVALATPTGRGAIGVIRLSGPESLSLTRALLGNDQIDLQHARQTLKHIKNPFTKEVVDQVLVCFFQ